MRTEHIENSGNVDDVAAIEVIINAGGGSFTEDHTEVLLREEFARLGLKVNFSLAASGEEIISLAEKAAASYADVIVAGGGDGTINAVATAVASSRKTLGILPLGTLNHFSRDLRIPADFAAAVSVIAGEHTTEVDVGEVNGHIFLNNSSIGLYPRIVRRREAEQERLGRGRWSAALSAAWRVFLRDPFVKVRIELDDRVFVRKTPFVFIGNNEYQMDFYNIGSRSRLNGGRLSIYFLHHGGRWGVVMLLVKTVFGVLRQAKEFETLSTKQVSLTTRKKRVMIAIDGETRVIESPLDYRIRPKYLRVLVPRDEAE
ncbi:MAG: diacylglycerol kinase family protein [Pyrinomonadaceae bacterium]